MIKIHIPTTYNNNYLSISSIRNMTNDELIRLVEQHNDPLVRHLAERLSECFASEKEYEEELDNSLRELKNKYHNLQYTDI